MCSPGRPEPSRAVQRDFWRLIASGVTTVHAAQGVGVSSPVGIRWFRHAGGMTPLSLDDPPGRYLSFVEREEIALFRAQDKGVRGRRAGRVRAAEAGQRDGRGETPVHKVVTIAAGILFPHAAQAVQIIRTRKRKGSSRRATRETVYVITSLTAEQAQPAELARYVRGHWHVENKLHWVRDVTMGEDASQISIGAGPRIMAGIRNPAISLLHLAGHTNIAKALRHNARKPKRATKLVLTS
jgi:predicted transposase YbfD/YdcC